MDSLKFVNVVFLVLLVSVLNSDNLVSTASLPSTNRTLGEVKRGQCYSDSDCQNGGHCSQTDDDYAAKFCACPIGTEGDFCQRNPECDAVDCGSDATCKLDAHQGNAVCVCNDPKLLFDRIDKRCKDITEACDTDIPECRISGGSCTLDNSDMQCTCPSGLVFTPHKGCTAAEGCNSRFPNCIETGGTCIVEHTDEFTGYRCDCPENSGYKEDIGCTEPCDENNPCQNGGECRGEGEHKFCKCLPDTSGDFCSDVEKCKPENKFCGEGIDVECVFDANVIKVACNCLNPEMTFDDKMKVCKKPCDENNPCQNGGECRGEGENRFCECLPDTSGDFCFDVEKCKPENKFCGEGIDVECVFDTNVIKVACNCLNPGMKFDDKTKMCKISSHFCDELISECRPSGGFCRYRNNSGPAISKEAIMCICPDDKVFEERKGCLDGNEICHYRMSECSATGGLCAFKNGITECFCGENSTFVNYMGCIDERRLCNSKLPNCIPTGGRCIYPKNDEPYCFCPDDRVLIDNIGCVESCNDTLPQCFPTGGHCIHENNGDPYCVCPDGTVFQEDTGCIDPVFIELCNSMLPGCTWTGGSCRFDKAHPYCDCPYRSIFVKYLGCRDYCDNYIPECERTGGICHGTNNFKDFECICSNGTVFETYEGCREYKKRCDYEIPECERTGGICLEKHNNTYAKCICTNGTEFVRSVGCKVTGGYITEITVGIGLVGWILCAVIAVLIITNIITLICWCKKK